MGIVNTFIKGQDIEQTMNDIEILKTNQNLTKFSNHRRQKENIGPEIEEKDTLNQNSIDNTKYTQMVTE